MFQSFCSSSTDGEKGVSRDAGVARRDQLGVRGRSRRAVGLLRCRIHVSGGGGERVQRSAGML